MRRRQFIQLLGQPAVMRAARLELVINLHTARALWPDVPDAILARTDGVIE